jgi:acetyl-CoA C-acetyltransferase
MREAVVVASSRTPLAKSFRGSLNRTRPDDQAAHCIRDVLRKLPQLAAEEIGDVILGCAEPSGQQGMNVARIALLRAGLPVTVPGTTVNRFCSSGLQTISMAAQRVLVDKVPVMIAGGLESVSLVQGPPGGNKNRLVNPWVQEHVPGIYHAMITTADTVAGRYKISREYQDE